MGDHNEIWASNCVVNGDYNYIQGSNNEIMGQHNTTCNTMESKNHPISTSNIGNSIINNKRKQNFDINERELSSYGNFRSKEELEKNTSSMLETPSSFIHQKSPDNLHIGMGPFDPFRGFFGQSEYNRNMSSKIPGISKKDRNIITVGDYVVDFPKGVCRYSIQNGVLFVNNQVYFDSKRPTEGYWPNRTKGIISQSIPEDVESQQRSATEKTSDVIVIDDLNEKSIPEQSQNLIIIEDSYDRECNVSHKHKKQKMKGAEILNHERISYDIPKGSDDNDKGKCVVCLESKSTVIFTTCGHLCLCEMCSDNYNEIRCPICRTTSKKIKVFIV